MFGHFVCNVIICIWHIFHHKIKILQIYARTWCVYQTLSKANIQIEMEKKKK